MAEQPKPDLRQTVDDDVRTQMRAIVTDARSASLGWLAPDEGHPMVSRVGLATQADGMPLIFISALAAHTQALANNPNCSLLIGEIGKGDPLAHPRLTLKCKAELVPGNDLANTRARYLSAHPKAQLYIDLPDFRFLQLRILGGSFNGGFGKAYDLQPGDLTTTA